MKAFSLAAGVVAACVAIAPAAHADLKGDMLAVHNAERASVGSPDLKWSDTLAADAARWAAKLASTGGFEHAGDADNPDAGENLWKGTAGAYSFTQMAKGWADEKADFKYGAFPDVSTNGNWASVGHYTQMIWRNTGEVGCAVATGKGWDVLVCRYKAPGNFMGQKPY